MNNVKLIFEETGEYSPSAEKNRKRKPHNWLHSAQCRHFLPSSHNLGWRPSRVPLPFFPTRNTFTGAPHGGQFSDGKPGWLRILFMYLHHKKPTSNKAMGSWLTTRYVTVRNMECSVPGSDVASYACILCQRFLKILFPSRHCMLTYQCGI